MRGLPPSKYLSEWLIGVSIFGISWVFFLHSMYEYCFKHRLYQARFLKYDILYAPEHHSEWLQCVIAALGCTASRGGLGLGPLAQR